MSCEHTLTLQYSNTPGSTVTFTGSLVRKLEMIASWMSFFTMTSVVYCVHVLFFLYDSRWGSKQSDSIVEPERKEEGFSLSFLERTVTT